MADESELKPTTEKQALRANLTVMASFAHEFGGSLSRLRGYLELARIRAADADAEGCTEGIEQAQTHAKHMADALSMLHESLREIYESLDAKNSSSNSS